MKEAPMPAGLRLGLRQRARIDEAHLPSPMARRKLLRAVVTICGLS
jgi:hypothetical protein